MPPETKSVIPAVFYRTLSVEGLEIFYREAGPQSRPGEAAKRKLHTQSGRLGCGARRLRSTTSSLLRSVSYPLFTRGLEYTVDQSSSLFSFYE
jgi:hypothetical protein